MINPEMITDYNLDECGLQEMILFWVCAAGKNGRTSARCLDKLLIDINGYEYPFQALRAQDPITLPNVLKRNGIGCYTTKARSMQELANSNINLRTCTLSDLESVYGIGPKTARCFILHSRKNVRVSGLDTHILKHLRSLGYDAPNSTPTGKKYLDIEKIVLMLSDKANMTPADYDLMVWNKYSIPSTQKVTI